MAETLSYCGKACDGCPVAHIATGSLDVDNTYVQYGTVIDTSTSENSLRTFAGNVDSANPSAVARAIMRIETGNCFTAP